MVLCPRCQKRNPDRSARCQYCGAVMAGEAAWVASPSTPISPPQAPRAGGRTNGLAIASVVLGILGLFSFGLLALVGLVLSIVSLRQIDLSQGRLQGRNLAVGGAVVSGLVLALMFFFFVPITAAVLFPVFAQAREQARSTACASNLRQVGFAMSMYAQDYDQRAPRKESWCDDVLPYVRDTRGMPRRVFQCPSLAGQSGAQAYNALLSAAPLAHLPSPSSLVEAFDARGGWNLSGGAQLADPRHRQGLNTLFVDGHVQWMRSLDRVAWKPGAPPAPETGRHHTRHRGRRHRHSGG